VPNTGLSGTLDGAPGSAARPASRPGTGAFACPASSSRRPAASERRPSTCPHRAALAGARRASTGP
jgi:hypothetical protein